MLKHISTAAALAATAFFATAAQAEVTNSFMRNAIDNGARVVAISKDVVIACRPTDGAPIQSCLRATYHFQVPAQNGGHSAVYRCDVVSAPSSTAMSVVVDEACSQIF
ncbi:MAG: hypothetical protein AB7F98_08515 [Novosphingobium sp.]